LQRSASITFHTIDLFLTLKILRLDNLCGVNESALVRSAGEVAKVSPEVCEAGGAAPEDGLGEFEVLGHVVDLQQSPNLSERL
jgi:hypothetical protein